MRATVQLQFHPEAAKRFDELADGLCHQVAPPPVASDDTGDFPIDPYAPVTLTDANVVGFRHWGRTDRAGVEIARYADANGRAIGVEGETYASLRRLAEKMQTTGVLRHTVATSIVFDLLFDWVCIRAGGTSEAKTASEYVIARVTQLIDQHTILIPLTDIFLESPVRIADIDLRTITREEIDGWASEWQKEHGSSIESSAVEWRRELQGKAAAVYTVTAEPQRAFEMAREKAEDAVAMLRIFSLGMIEPRVQSFCALRGAVCAEKSIHAVLRNGRMQGLNSRLNAPLGTFWKIDTDHLEWMLKNGLADMSNLLEEEPKNDFQSKLLEALLLYSRAALEGGLAEKLLYVIVALEALLLRSESEPIQGNISERLAFGIGKNSADRKHISRIVKDAYALRSRFVHHGHQVADVSVMQDFLVIAFYFFTATVSRHKAFSSKDQFIEALEEPKWA